MYETVKRVVTSHDAAGRPMFLKRDELPVVCF